MRQIGQGFDIVHHGRLVVEPVRGGERRLDTREAALAFERFQQRRLFAANIGARSAVYPNVDRGVRAENVLADISRGARVIDGLFENLGPQDKFPANIDVGAGRADGVAGEQHAFEQLVRVTFDELPIFEGTRFAFIGVAAEVARTLVVLGQEPPFDSGREAGAAAPAQAGLHDHRSHVRRAHLAQHLPDRLVAADAFILRQRTRIAGLQHVFQQNRFVLGHSFSVKRKK